MALVNDVKREINVKIVYLGPEGAGKSTALRQIYGRLTPECRSEFKSMPVGSHQMLFFDFSYPGPVREESYQVRFHIYTFLAGAGQSPPWKMLLKGADGVILFADSADGRMYANLESCAVLMDAIAHYGRRLGDLAISLQCNKRDLPDALPPDLIKAELMPELSAEPVPVTAVSGDGLLDGLNGVARQILAKLGLDPHQASFAEVPRLPQRGEVLAADGADDAREAFDHCSTDHPEFSVETAGAPVAVDASTIVIPLRITGGACGKSAGFKVTVSVSL